MGTPAPQPDGAYAIVWGGVRKAALTAGNDQELPQQELQSHTPRMVSVNRTLSPVGGRIVAVGTRGTLTCVRPQLAGSARIPITPGRPVGARTMSALVPSTKSGSACVSSTKQHGAMVRTTSPRGCST